MVLLPPQPTKSETEMNGWLRDYLSKGFRFAVSGATGVLVNLSILYALTTYAHLWYILSELIAILVTFVTNYNMNLALRVIRIEKTARS